MDALRISSRDSVKNLPTKQSIIFTRITFTNVLRYFFKDNYIPSEIPAEYLAEILLRVFYYFFPEFHSNILLKIPSEIVIEASL